MCTTKMPASHVRAPRVPRAAFNTCESESKRERKKSQREGEKKAGEKSACCLSKKKKLEGCGGRGKVTREGLRFGC
jgi:hypothetical protein